MLKDIQITLATMGWLGVVLGILIIVNTICGTVSGLYSGEKFSWKKMGKGLLKASIFYISAAITGIAFTILPYINTMIADNFNIVLLSDELLDTLSGVVILGVVVSTVVVQAKKALEGIVELANISIEAKEEITWEIIDPEEETRLKGGQ